ncbi:fimbrial protein [Serratia sarumanii]|uniref:fimbrial protein n=1 Tax=Serratia sarumanii TaxID=3020826 RepID=UPI003F7D0973
MKKNSFFLAMFFSIVSPSVLAASSGTITFNGTLIDSTCEVTVNGQSADAVINLPAISMNQLSKDNETAGRTFFTLNLSKCGAGQSGAVQKVSAYFQGGDSVDVSSGRLLNKTGTAKGVGLQLLDASRASNFKVISLGNANQVNDLAYTEIQNGSAVLPYAVEYYATGKTAPGTITSSVTYSLQYK